MKLDPIKKKRQDEIVESWWNNNGKGTLEAVTGFGKTVVGLMASRKVQKIDIGHILVVVPTLYLQNQWRELLSKWKISGATVLVINTAIKTDHQIGFLILDEIHMYTAKTFGKIFDRVSYKMILGLTATMHEDDVKRHLITRHAPIIARVRVEEALKNNWVSQFDVYNLAIPLSEEEKQEYSKLNKNFGRYFAHFNYDFDLVLECLKNYQACQQLGRKLNRPANEVKGNAVNFMKAMHERKAYLHGIPSKLDAAEEIIRRFNTHKTITFSQTIKSAEDLAGRLGSIAQFYHASMKKHVGLNGKTLAGKRARDDVIKRFKTDDFLKSCRVICTAKALDMGADLPEVDMGIILSGTSKSRQGVQRYGRTLRFIAGKKTIIVELYVPDSQDLKWLKSRQEQIPESAIHWILSIDEISSEHQLKLVH